ncbi:MAG: hypothetical protein ACON42_04965 [Flavobacteriaceae bacterium]
MLSEIPLDFWALTSLVLLLGLCLYVVYHPSQQQSYLFSRQNITCHIWPGQQHTYRYSLMVWNQSAQSVHWQQLQLQGKQKRSSHIYQLAALQEIPPNRTVFINLEEDRWLNKVRLIVRTTSKNKITSRWWTTQEVLRE